MDTEYIITCAQELGSISPLEGVVLEHHPEVYQAIRQAVDGNQAFDDAWLANTCRQTLEKSPPNYRKAASILALRNREFHINCMVERLNHLIGEKVALDLNWQGNRQVTLGKPINPKETFFTDEASVNEFIIHKLLDAMDEARLMKLRLQQDKAELWCTLSELGCPLSEITRNQIESLSAPSSAIDKSKVAIRRKIPRKVREFGVTAEMRKRAQTAIKKASELFYSLGKERELQMFLNGQEVTISHTDSNLKFVVRALDQNDWLVRRSVCEFSAHTPFELSLFTKSDVFIGNICLYFAESPVLDQLLGLTLYIQAGDEELLLEKANIFSTSHWTPEFADQHAIRSPALRKKIMNPKKIRQLHEAVPEKYAKWEPFKNPATQWILAWLGPELRVFNDLRLPTSIACLTYEEATEIMNRLLGVQPKQHTCIDDIRLAIIR